MMVDLVGKSKPVIGKVTSAPRAGEYVVETNSGKKHHATSTQQYSIGNSVVVIDGQIIGLSGTRPEPQVFNV